MDADEVMRVAVTRFPQDIAVHLEYAGNAHQRGEWTTAAERWALMRERFPECIEAREKEMEALAAPKKQCS